MRAAGGEAAPAAARGRRAAGARVARRARRASRAYAIAARMCGSTVSRERGALLAYEVPRRARARRRRAAQAPCWHTKSHAAWR